MFPILKTTPVIDSSNGDDLMKIHTVLFRYSKSVPGPQYRHGSGKSPFHEIPGRMTVLARRIFLTALPAAVFTGCVTVKDTVFLQDLAATSPLYLPPVHLTRNDNHPPVTISPYISVMNNTAINSTIAANVYEPDSLRMRRHHLSWTLPASSVGFNASVPLSPGVGISMGLSHSAQQGEEYWTGALGLSLPFHGEDISGRIEGGYHWQSASYDAFSMLVRETTPLIGSPEYTIFYFHDIDRTTTGNIYFTFSLNTTADRLLNGDRKSVV
jgi:hypothetical protein